jgi:hypothetical protein
LANAKLLASIFLSKMNATSASFSQFNLTSSYFSLSLSLSLSVFDALCSEAWNTKAVISVKISWLQNLGSASSSEFKHWSDFKCTAQKAPP